MLEERLKAANRVPDATFLTISHVQGYGLRFHKRSIDQSGKCNIVRTDSVEDVVYGVVFEIPDDQLEALDRAEGIGQGYHHDYNVPVRLSDGTEISMLAYIADSNAIDDKLIPYVWYHKLVIAGAEQHQLPDDYIANLRAVPSIEDPDPNSPTKREAEAALNAYYSKIRA
ncbi:MAG TPA: gamma-glutamylcyclotransferase [Blastocatellia bacterium]|nr:gamma-glutamylcyclotransferase [Blastocatellia bacterium]